MTSFVTSERATSFQPVLVSEILGLLMPAVLGVYWVLFVITPDMASNMMRAAILGFTFLLLLIWIREPLTRAELRFSGALMMFSALLVVPSLTATDPIRAFNNWARILLVYLIAIGLSRCLRHEGTARAFGFSMLLGSLVPCLIILFLYTRYMGMTLPTYEAARNFKGLVSRSAGIALNPVAFSAVFSYVIGMCLVRRKWFYWSLGIPIVVISSLLTGSRAPIAITAVSGLVLLLLNLIRHRALFVRFFVWTGLILTTAAGLYVLAVINPKTLASITEGRTDLWSVGWDKFLESPLVGFGAESWRDDVISRLPGQYELTSSLVHLGGGFHSEYVTLMAEGGLLMLAAAAVVIYLLFMSCWRLAFDPRYKIASGQMLLFGCIFMLMRAGVEVPGLFGYGQDEADFLAAVFVAIVVSRLSQREDLARAVAFRRRASVGGAPLQVPLSAGSHAS
jgi:O-antigen ligase